MNSLAWLLVLAGSIVLVDGFALAVKEESRGSYGRVVNGVVTRRSTIDGAWTTWVIDYRFPCRTRSGSCSGREIVSHELWDRLRAGVSVRVRQADGEVVTGRLDDNPQGSNALIKVLFACVLFACACVAAGRLRFRGIGYKKAPAVVIAVQPLAAGRETRWRIKFAYFDAKGNAQESVDEVNDPSWKVNDDCIAVYRPQAPDMATLQPLANR